VVKERRISIDEGRIKSGSFKCAPIVCRTYERQGAIGFEIDDPETLARIEKALADYAVAVREDHMRPREEPPRRNCYFDSPLDQFSLHQS